MKQVERLTGRGCDSPRLHQFILIDPTKGANRIDWDLIGAWRVRRGSYRKCNKTINAENNTAYEDYALAA